MIELGPLRVEASLVPPRLDVRRDARTLLHALTPWACEGEVRDRLVTFTEGVIADEVRGFPERPVQAELRHADARSIRLGLRLRGGRRARMTLGLAGPEHLVVELEAEGDPLRLGLEWDARATERFAGLGARHALRVDHAGRTIQLGADRRYTGPDCPPDLLEMGGIPQGDYAPAPWLQSSRGYALWCETHGNGTRWDLDGGGSTVGVSTRAVAGPLRLHVLTDPTPAARLRRYLRMTGLPALLPPWGYGFWKSRDVYEHRDDAEEDFHGCRWHGIPLDAIVLDSPWETHYNTWEPNPHQFPDFAGMVARWRAAGVRTVVWVTPWVNLDAIDGQVPPDPESRRLHRGPAPTYAEGERLGLFVRAADGEAHVARWWMGTGSMIDFTNPDAEAWWRAQAVRTLRLGVEGIKADDGEGYYVGDELRFADGSRGGETAWRYGLLYRRSMQRALDEAHGPGRGVVFGRSGWTGQQAVGHLWAGDQASDFWSLRTLVAATVAAAASGFSNWSHDVGGYLGRRVVERCPPELLVRWAQLGCFTPLMQAHGRLQQEPWTYDRRTLELYRGYVLLHEMLNPYLRAAAATAARSGLPIVRPASLLAGGDWEVADAFCLGPALWVAPVIEEGATEREAWLPPGDWIETWSGARVRGGREVLAPAPLHAIPVWVRAGAIVVTHPAGHVGAGLGDAPDAERPLVATLWGEPRCGRAAARLADGTTVRWVRGRWSTDRERDVAYALGA
ncbi:MAG: alpha-D-xyloside xylohydrolase [Solirubrobacteraceae bacterium]|nr:alpha-D-xyloside xylohydrolase [Solirubrobacteraceae bacterium]